MFYDSTQTANHGRHAKHRRIDIDTPRASHPGPPPTNTLRGSLACPSGIALTPCKRLVCCKPSCRASQVTISHAILHTHAGSGERNLASCSFLSRRLLSLKGTHSALVIPSSTFLVFRQHCINRRFWEPHHSCALLHLLHYRRTIWELIWWLHCLELEDIYTQFVFTAIII